MYTNLSIIFLHGEVWLGKNVWSAVSGGKHSWLVCSYSSLQLLTFRDMNILFLWGRKGHLTGESLMICISGRSEIFSRVFFFYVFQERSTGEEQRVTFLLFLFYQIFFYLQIFWIVCPEPINSILKMFCCICGNNEIMHVIKHKFPHKSRILKINIRLAIHWNMV